MLKGLYKYLLCLACVALVACGGSDSKNSNSGSNNAGGGGGGDGGGGNAQLQVPSTYAFPSRFDKTKDSVGYAGQTLRQVLINDMGAYLRGLTKALENNTTLAAGDVRGALDFYFTFDSDANGDEVPLITADAVPLLQTTYGSIVTNKNLRTKLAGVANGWYKTTNRTLLGWNDPAHPEVNSPEKLIDFLFDIADDVAMSYVNGTHIDGNGDLINSAVVTSSGVNLQQLLAKFLIGSVTYSQALGYYLDDGIDGKGLKADNTTDSGSGYTGLEHAWDEAFGYLGASRDFTKFLDGDYPDGKKYYDANGDGKIDLGSEMVYSFANYAASRDAGSAASSKTTFAKDGFNAYLRGRAIISNATGALTAEEKQEVEAQRDIISNSWEKVLAACAVHYLNTVIVDTSKYGTADFSLTSVAGHWSEMKGFLLSLQFNPRKKISDADFTTVNNKVGSIQPIIDASEAAAYKTALLEARDILQTVYGFSDANIGDENGLNGW